LIALRYCNFRNLLNGVCLFRYLDKRERQQIELLRRKLKDEEFIFANEELTEGEKRRYEMDKDILQHVEERVTVVWFLVVIFALKVPLTCRSVPINIQVLMSRFCRSRNRRSIICREIGKIRYARFVFMRTIFVV